MIKNKDRSKWFGASDTHFIMGKWNTKTFAKWWSVKLGLIQNNFSTISTIAGNEYEHRIANAISERINEDLILDRQIKCRKYRVRVNLDSETKSTIYEIKTFKAVDDWKPTKSYEMQLQVQMYFAKKKGCIVAYPLEEENYRNLFIPVEKEKLLFFNYDLDKSFIKKYLQRVKYLKKCLIKGKLPNLKEMENE